MNACSTVLAVALFSLCASAQAQHDRLVHTPQGTAPATDMASAPARHVEAEHLSEVTVVSDDPPATQAPAATMTADDHHAARVVQANQPAHAVGHHRIGDATRSLLRLQASGQAAPAALPMLGEQANAAYKRHLESFNHPIPEFFDTAVPSSNSSP